MAEREIKIRSHTWMELIEDPHTGEEVLISKEARRGDVVDLSENEIARGEQLDVFMTDEDRVPNTTEEGLALLDLDDEELTDWVSDSTIPQVLNAANDDPEMAERLLAAENAATGNDPRSGLVEGLARISGASE